MTESRRYSAAWLTAAAVLFIADIFLHLPISDLCDTLVKRYGFFPFDGVVRRGFEAVGGVCLCAAWLSPRRERTVVSTAAVTLAMVVIGAQFLIVLNGVEDVHYPQYALLAYVAARGLPSLEAAWAGATLLGAVDEGYQYVALPRGTPAYYDWNDVVLNAIGSALGILIAVAWARRAVRTELLPRRWLLLIVCAGITAAVIVAPPVFRPFFDVTPGGRRFHNMAGWEALTVVAGLWWAVRYFVTRAISSRAPNFPAT